jgi:hypothetical protein
MLVDVINDLSLSIKSSYKRSEARDQIELFKKNRSH